MLQHRESILIAGLLLGLSTSSMAATYLVNPAGTGDFPTIEAAIAAAAGGDIIELADGTFTGDGNRDLSYQGKAITIRSQSGDPSLCTLDCGGSPLSPHRAFTFENGESSASILEGVLITGGHAADGGGAIHCNLYSSPTIRNCVFLANSAHGGGAMWLYHHSDAIISGCTFAANWCTGQNGGGLLIGFYSNPQISDCIFDGNTSTSGSSFGGGVLCYTNSSPTLTDCIFTGNSVNSTGGGIYCGWNSSPILTGCTFMHNTALVGGGGARCYEGSDPAFINCTFYENWATYGGGVYCTDGSIPTLENSIVAFSTSGSGVYCGGGCTALLSCSDVYGNSDGDWIDCIADQLDTNGNFAADPQFCSRDETDLHLADTSPCAPDNNATCGLVGAWSTGCGAQQVDPRPPSGQLGLSAWPNPLTRATQVSYRVSDPHGGMVNLAVYDASGRKVRNLCNGHQAPGLHHTTWDGTDDLGDPVAGGSYFFQLSVGDETTTRRTVLVK